MGGVVIREASLSDVLQMTLAARRIDRREGAALTGLPWRQALERTYRRSAWTRVGSYLSAGGEDLVAVWGVVPDRPLEGVGCPWMVATPAIEARWRAFVREAAREVAEMRETWVELYNLVALENSAAVGWLGRLGFSFGEVTVRRDMAFSEFYWRRENPRPAAEIPNSAADIPNSESERCASTR